MIKRALQAVNSCYASVPANDFGPLKLQAVRQSLIDQDLSRRYINDLVCTIAAMFKWGASQELVPVESYLALKTVGGLRKGRSGARETDPVQPVSEKVILATIAHASPVVAAMINLQLRTGARPGEVCSIRPGDITYQTNGVWCYRPQNHKTELLGKERRIYIGPQGQEVLKPWLNGRSPDAYCFSPREAAQARRAALRFKAERKKPNPARRKSKPLRSPGERYTKDSYCRAVKRAARRAGVEEWTPHQLRHSRATIIRRRFGVEAARVILGHSDARVTEVYAERDFGEAARIMREIG